MKLQNIGLALGLTGYCVVQHITAAQALSYTFNWQFITDDVSTGGPGNLVSGTISHLQEGSNNGDGVQIKINTTPGGELQGTRDWSFMGTWNGGDAFIVTKGVVTYADAYFSSSQGGLTFGLNNNGGYTPFLYYFDPSNPIIDTTSDPPTQIPNVMYSSNKIIFSNGEIEVPWEWNPTEGVALGVPLFIGLRILKKRLKRKSTASEAAVAVS